MSGQSLPDLIAELSEENIALRQRAEDAERENERLRTFAEQIARSHHFDAPRAEYDTPASIARDWARQTLRQEEER